MELNILFEERSIVPITITRDLRDREAIKNLGRQWNGGKAFRPPLNYTTVIAKDGGQIVGFASAKNFTNEATLRKIGVDPKYKNTDLKKRLLNKLLKLFGSLQYGEFSARAKADDSDIYTEVLGDPVGQNEYKKGIVNKYKKNLKGEISTEQRQTDRVVTRAGPLYKS